MTPSKNKLRIPEIALLEARMAEQLERLFVRNGGAPVSVAAVKERPENATGSVARLIDRLTASEVDVVVFQTGVSIGELARTADRIGRLPELKDGLRSIVTVSRGPKVTGALGKLGLKPAVSVSMPHTTHDVIAALDKLRLAGKSITVVHHGDRNETLISWLGTRTNRIHEIYLYKWRLPDDTRPLEALCRQLIGGRFDAIAFTSQVQARHLFRVAEGHGLRADLTDTLNGGITVAAIGPTCATALSRFGVNSDVVPEHPKMGHMVLALMERLAATQDTDIPVIDSISPNSPVGASA